MAARLRKFKIRLFLLPDELLTQDYKLYLPLIIIIILTKKENMLNGVLLRLNESQSKNERKRKRRQVLEPRQRTKKVIEL